jgi:hypothetical protein
LVAGVVLELMGAQGFLRLAVLVEAALEMQTRLVELEHLDKEIMEVMGYIPHPHIQQVAEVVRVQWAGVTLVLQGVLVELDWQTQLLGLLQGNCQEGYII